MNLDPTIAALCDNPPESPIPWARLEAKTLCSRETYFARLAEGLIRAGAELVAGYMATEKRARRARHRAYSLRVVEPARKLTRAEQVRRDAVAFGLVAA